MQGQLQSRVEVGLVSHQKDQGQGGGHWQMLPLRPINLRDVGETEKDTLNLGLFPFGQLQKEGGPLAQDRRNLAFDRPTARPFKCFFHRSKGGILLCPKISSTKTGYQSYRLRQESQRQTPSVEEWEVTMRCSWPLHNRFNLLQCSHTGPSSRTSQSPPGLQARRRECCLCGWPKRSPTAEASLTFCQHLDLCL